MTPEALTEAISALGATGVFVHVDLDVLDALTDADLPVLGPDPGPRGASDRAS